MQPPKRPYYLCIFDGSLQNKEDLKSYKYILQVQFSSCSPTCLDVIKIVYAGGYRTLSNLQEKLTEDGYHVNKDHYFCKEPVKFEDTNICGQLEQAGLTDEPYLCMETVEHLFAPYPAPQGTHVYIVGKHCNSMEGAYTILEVQHKYLTTFEIKQCLVNTYEWMYKTQKIRRGEMEIYYPNLEGAGFSQTFLDKAIYSYESIGIIHEFKHEFNAGYITRLMTEEDFCQYRNTLFPLSQSLKDRVTKLNQHFANEWWIHWQKMEEKLLEAGITLESLEILDCVADALLPL